MSLRVTRLWMVSRAPMWGSLFSTTRKCARTAWSSRTCTVSLASNIYSRTLRGSWTHRRSRKSAGTWKSATSSWLCSSSKGRVRLTRSSTSRSSVSSMRPRHPLRSQARGSETSSETLRRGRISRTSSISMGSLQKDMDTLSVTWCIRNK